MVTIDPREHVVTATTIATHPNSKKPPHTDVIYFLTCCRSSDDSSEEETVNDDTTLCMHELHQLYIDTLFNITNIFCLGVCLIACFLGFPVGMGKQAP